MSDLDRVIREAMQLMRGGDLHAATRAIQRGLRFDGAEVAPDTAKPPSSWIVGEYRVLDDSAVAPSPPTPDPYEQPARDKPRDGTFTSHRFRCAAGSMQYKLFVPCGSDTGAPLLVMLHGCTQSPDDFARGTRMNALAQEHGFLVAYPVQAQSKNANKCWNWFRAGDQQRGAGEPAVIAALTRHLVQEHALDARRVYVAGLSAGGAMAAVLGATYPDVYAAIGVHSGLPFGAARDLPSAMAAMAQGGSSAAEIGKPVPAIVFHGDRDVTVNPCNGGAVVDQFIRGEAPGAIHTHDASQITVERGSVPNGRNYTRTVYRNANGAIVAEHWEVHGAGHAWFGGDSSGTYTDPTGPDASEHMLRFFRACTLRTIN